MTGMDQRSMMGCKSEQTTNNRPCSRTNSDGWTAVNRQSRFFSAGKPRSRCHYSLFIFCSIFLYLQGPRLRASLSALLQTGKWRGHKSTERFLRLSQRMKIQVESGERKHGDN